MSNLLGLAITLAFTLTQPGRIIEESELPPAGERPAQSAPESTAPQAPEAEQRTTTQTPAELQAPEDSAADAAPEPAQQAQDTQETPRAGSRVMAFWMIPPTQANP